MVAVAEAAAAEQIFVIVLIDNLKEQIYGTIMDNKILVICLILLRTVIN